MAMSREVIRYRAEFKPDVVRLLTEFWPSPADAAAQFEWLHEANPFTPEPLAYLGLIDGKVMGMRGFYGARWEITGTGQVFDVPCGNMFVVDPAARGQRLASAITRDALDDLAARGYGHVLSLSARPIPFMSQMRSGWRLVASYQPLERETPKARLRRVLRERAPGLRRGWRRLQRRPAGTAGESPRWRSRAFLALDQGLPPRLGGGKLRIARKPDAEAMARLAQTAMRQGRFRHVRTAEYFAWRFREPLTDHRFLTWSKGAERGVLVLEAGRSARGQVRIFDWQATGIDVLTRLIGAAIEFGRFDRVWTWRSALPDRLDGFLSDNGFQPSDESMGVPDYAPGMMLKTLGGGAAQSGWAIDGLALDAAENWSLRPAYSI